MVPDSETGTYFLKFPTAGELLVISTCNQYQAILRQLDIEHEFSYILVMLWIITLFIMGKGGAFWHGGGMRSTEGPLYCFYVARYRVTDPSSEARHIEKTNVVMNVSIQYVYAQITLNKEHTVWNLRFSII